MIERNAAKTIKKLAKNFKAVAVTGPRQSGKTTLLKMVFPKKPYVSLENPDIQRFALEDPRGFLNNYPKGAILDEVQRSPHLFSYLQEILDHSKTNGLFVLSGSNNFLLQQNISQSLSGRVGYLELLPFSLSEAMLSKRKIKRWEDLAFWGSYPSVLYKKINPHFWFSSYIRTYIERDVRLIKNIGNLTLFQKLLQLCAGRVGQQLNLSALSSEIGVDYKTIQSWIHLLEASYILFLMPPYYKNYNKRITKAPKLYFYDTGLASYLLGIEKVDQIKTHFAKGALFENLMISEMVKSRLNNGAVNRLYYFRDSSGNEVDVVWEQSGNLYASEVKSAETINGTFFSGLSYFKNLTSLKYGYLVFAGKPPVKKTDDFTILNWKEISTL